MQDRQQRFFYTGFFLALALVCGQRSSRAVAEPQQYQPQNAFQIAQYTPPPDRGTPPSNKTTGSRGNCLFDGHRPALAALVGQPHLPWTISDRPTLWFYNPYTAAETLRAELILQSDATDQELYRGSLSLGDQPGIQGVQLPAAIAPLQVGQTYRWYIDIYCPAQTTAIATDFADTTPASLTGVVERVATPVELSQGLKAVGGDGEEAIALYGQNHLWYDLLTALARQRLENPGDRTLQQLWQTLLQDEANVGLAFLSEEPLIGEWVLE